MIDRKQAGFSLVEMLISLTVLSLALTGLYGLLIHNSRLNKSEQMKAETNENARAVLSILVQKLRSSGWDPLGTDLFAGVTLDPNLGDTISEITIRSDYHSPLLKGTPDGLASLDDEVIHFRHLNNTIIWDTDSDGTYEVLAINISNDADGDGTIEPMFVPDSTTDPQHITVQITARSPVVDPITRDFSRVTVTADVHIRKKI